ncbi:2-octaprenyl-6-methoxyphenyl hydroxylase [Pokkaliibacter sp. CJK22405]|uniref:2-octaprenyl-6-methoxyphenyl hydroxylase n=1 Tax=Pokkaliibacter sp. CJK22405 TaxID=3384615 RepID=UPI00398503D7
MSENAHQVDILIVGGGLVGASLACALLPYARSTGLSIAVVEQVALPSEQSQPWQPSYDARGTALSFGTRLIYEDMGLWQQLSEHASPIEHIHVSDQGHYGTTRLHAEEEGVPALGYVVENHWVGRVLHGALSNEEAIEWLCPATVTGIVMQADGAAVTIDQQGGKKTLKASLVVMADGGRSALATELGLDYLEMPYHQSALVSTITPSHHHNQVAYERFTEEGPLALLPLENGADGKPRMALVWTTPEEELEARMEWVEDDFLAAVQDAFGYRLGRFEKMGERYAYPLALKQAREQIRSRLVVLGNAAHSLHPIAGQGYNLALRSVAMLAQLLQEAHQQGRDVGHLDTLQRFLEMRQQDQLLTIGFSDKVMKLFSQPRWPARLARDTGLVALNLFAPARHRLARAAMGLDAPRARFRFLF